MKESNSMLLCKLAVTLCIFFCIQLIYANPVMAADFENNGNGTITIEYDNTQSSKMKVAVMKDSSKYYYDMKEGLNNMVIPLTEGNGTYKVMVCRNTKGNSYAVLATETVELDLKDGKDAFLQSCYIISWDATNDAIKKAQSLTKNSKTQNDKLKAIYDYIVKNYKYDYDKAADVKNMDSYVPNIQTIYKDKKGICYDISVMMASMYRSVDIPAKVVTGHTPNATTYHAWNSIYNSKQKKWKIIDATYDLQMYQKKKSYQMYKPDKDYSEVIYTY